MRWVIAIALLGVANGGWADGVRAEMVLSRASHAWMSQQIEEPCILPNPKVPGRLIMFYSAVSASDRVVAAIGKAWADVADPFVWHQDEANPIFGPSGHGWDATTIRLDAVLYVPEEDAYYIYYSGTAGNVQDHIGLAICPAGEDGYSGVNATNIVRYGTAPVLAPEPAAPYCEEMASQAGVLREWNEAEKRWDWYMYYSYRGKDGTLPGIRLATSHDGKSWTRHFNEADPRGMGQIFASTPNAYYEWHQAFKLDGTYVLCIEVGIEHGVRWRPVLAVSTDPAHGWTQLDPDTMLQTKWGAAYDDRTIYHVATPALYEIGGRWYLFTQACGRPSNDNYIDGAWEMWGFTCDKIIATRPGCADLHIPGVPEYIHPEKLKPSGTRYEATVPDTLDLAERARLSVHGLTSFLNPGANYAPYGHTYLNANPPYMSDMPGGPPNWGKIAESLLMARTMSGSEENLDIEAKMLDGMLASPWMTLNPVAPTPVSRAMLALMALYQLDPDPNLKARIDAMAQAHIDAARPAPDGLFFNNDPPDTRETALGVNGTWMPVFIQGCAIRPLTRWGAMTDNAPCTDLASKLARHLTNPEFWIPEAEPKVVAGAEHGHFAGHHHSYTQGLLGLLWYAEAAHDTRLKQFVRDSYEYMRNFGIARLGLFGEGCTTGDMTLLALRLSLAGACDYWDDADQYVRNHLAELQITDAEKLRAVCAKMPSGRGKNDTTQGPFDPANETQENVVERNVGVFLSDSTHPTLIPEHCFLYTICCTGNCTPALYAAWASIVTCDSGIASVNLLLNRASEWLDVDSYLPYEGKVVLHIKTAEKAIVRMPNWANLAAVETRVNGQPIKPFWAARRLVVDSLKSGDVVTIAFPVPETVEEYTLKWKQSEFWKESTNPGTSWQPLPDPAKYTCRFRGNTLIDISPRDEGLGYPLYERERLKQSVAPMMKVQRYIPAVVLKW